MSQATYLVFHQINDSGIGEVLVMKKVTRALMIAFIIANLQGCAVLVIACEIIDDTRGSECEF